MTVLDRTRIIKQCILARRILCGPLFTSGYRLATGHTERASHRDRLAIVLGFRRLRVAGADGLYLRLDRSGVARRAGARGFDRATVAGAGVRRFMTAIGRGLVYAAGAVVRTCLGDRARVILRRAGLDLNRGRVAGATVGRVGPIAESRIGADIAARLVDRAAESGRAVDDPRLGLVFTDAGVGRFRRGRDRRVAVARYVVRIGDRS